MRTGPLIPLIPPTDPVPGRLRSEWIRALWAEGKTRRDIRITTGCSQAALTSALGHKPRAEAPGGRPRKRCTVCGEVCQRDKYRMYFHPSQPAVRLDACAA